MKNKTLIITTTIILIFFSECKKYEEGPLLSLRSANNRIAGSWDIINYKINGNDSTNNYKTKYGSSITFDMNDYEAQDEIFNQMYIISGLGGRWKIDEEKLYLGYDYVKYNYDTIEEYPFNSNKTVVFDIKKLTNKELKIESKINNYDFRIELEKRN